MANDDKPRGFWPIRHLGGGQIRTNPYLISSSTGTAMARGDLVGMESTGNIEVAAADTGTTVVGVFESCTYVDADGNRVYADIMPATKTGFTQMVGYVWDDPKIVFGVQADSGTAVAEATSRGYTANHVATAADSTRNLSQHELDSSDIGTGLQLRILNLINRPGNSWAEHADLEVVINEHMYGGGSTDTSGA
jgi:hypothetical protein